MASAPGEPSGQVSALRMKATLHIRHSHIEQSVYNRASVGVHKIARATESAASRLEDCGVFNMGLRRSPFPDASGMLQEN